MTASTHDQIVLRSDDVRTIDRDDDDDSDDSVSILKENIFVFFFFSFDVTN